MRIVFFGSSHGVPEPNRKCSSAMIEVDGEHRYIIDMGTQAIEQLVDRNIPVESVKAIFITHMHGDHTNGLLSFLDLCGWAFKKADPMIYLPGDVEKTKKAIGDWLACTGSKLKPYEFRQVNEGEIFDDGVIRVTAYRTEHTDASFAFLVEAEGKRVLFGGDLRYGNHAADFPMETLEKPLDLAICECAHLKATEFVPLFKGNGNLKKLCINHYAARFWGSMIEAREELSKEMEVIFAADGLEINV